MKQFMYLILTILFFNIGFSQTTHNYNWSMNSTNQQIVIDAGDTVIWTWGSGTHNLRSTGGDESFDSGYHSSGYQFSYTFNTPGVTTYICDPHPNSMYGTVTVTGTASIASDLKLNFDISPNPVSNSLNLKFNQNISTGILVEIYDILGKLIYKETSVMNNQRNSIDVSDLNRGIYIVKIYSGNNISIKKFTKK